MLKIEIIKFEAQDVITTSDAGPTCICNNSCFYDATGHLQCIGHRSTTCPTDDHPNARG